MIWNITSLLLLLASCAQAPQSAAPAQETKVTIIKQWHASATTSTLDIAAAKLMPQYANQKEIYDHLAKPLNEGKRLLLLAEGCQAEKKIDLSFNKKFNGWSMPLLSKARDSQNYGDILTALPMKLKAKYPTLVTVICADDQKLMKMNQTAFSDARGFIGFFLRLKEHQNDPKKYAVYHRALEEAQRKKIDDPMEFSREQAIESINHFKTLIEMRNQLFLAAIVKYLPHRPTVIIGGLHAQGLMNMLSDNQVPAEILTPVAYPISSEALPQQLLEELQASP